MDNLKTLKERKLFDRYDFVLYIILLVLIFALFLFFVILPETHSVKGFKVVKQDNLVLTYYYDSNKIEIENDFLTLVEVSDTEKGKNIKIYTDQSKTGYNTLFVNTEKYCVSVIDSTCSVSKDCTHMPEISDKGAIYCAPHQLKISPVGDSGFLPPVAG